MDTCSLIAYQISSWYYVPALLSPLTSMGACLSGRRHAPYGMRVGFRSDNCIPFFNPKICACQCHWFMVCTNDHALLGMIPTHFHIWKVRRKAANINFKYTFLYSKSIKLVIILYFALFFLWYSLFLSCLVYTIHLLHTIWPSLSKCMNKSVCVTYTWRQPI